MEENILFLVFANLKGNPMDNKKQFQKMKEALEKMLKIAESIPTETDDKLGVDARNQFIDAEMQLSTSFLAIKVEKDTENN